MNQSKFYRFLHSRKIIQNWELYLLLIPAILFYIIFCYAPLYGLQLGFKDFSASRGITGSPWADQFGLEHFIRFFESPFLVRLISNTLAISLLQLILGFPFPIILALMVNELSNKRVQKIVQNITYFPYFLSAVVLVGMVRNFVNPDYGIINLAIKAFGGTPHAFFTDAEWFRPLYVLSGIWQTAGWNSIIFVAALAGVDPQMHESAKIDGANRFHRLWYINLPSIAPTIIIILILNMGQIMNIGFEKAFLFQSDLTLSKSDIISTYVYRVGIQGAQYSYSTAIGLFNSVINCLILVAVNTISRKISNTSLW